MGELRREFLKQTILNLQNLQQESFGQETFSEDLLRRCFRQLHTIKGTSLTFDLDGLAHFAHQTENLLQALQTDQIPQKPETYYLFQSSLQHLFEIAENSLNGKELPVSVDLVQRIQNFLPSETKDSKDLLFHHIPNKFLTQLTEPEKTNLGIALQKGKFFYLLEVFFEFSNFDQEFKRFKQVLNQNGEVIAVASATTEVTATKIGFQIFFAGKVPRAEIETLISDFPAKIVFQNSPVPKSVPNNPEGLVANLVIDGEKIAQILNKKVVFETTFAKVELTNERLILLNVIASHLIHNAIDHGIEAEEERVLRGKNPLARVQIALSTIENKLLLQITDDGRGINPEKISLHAKERGLIPSDKVLDEEEALHITFQPGFTTSETVSEISGRGVGLDAVRDLVEQSNGQIEVETKFGQGTSFSIYLPQN